MKTRKIVLFFVLALLLFGCASRRNSEKGAAKYRQGYHALSKTDSTNQNLDSIFQASKIGFLPALPPRQFELSRWQFNRLFRLHKKEVKAAAKAKTVRAKRDFIIEKKEAKQKGKTDRKEVKEDGRTNRSEVKQTGKTDRTKVRRENGFFSGKFSTKILLSVFLFTFALITIYLLRKKSKQNARTKEARPDDQL